MRAIAIPLAAAILSGAAGSGGDGRAQPVPPLTLCIVVDLTVSMLQLPGLGFDADAADDQVAVVMSGLDTLLGPADRVRFGRVARTVAFGPSFVGRDEIGRAVRVLGVTDADRYGPSPVWDAVDEALSLIEAESGRRAVILWSDGRASGNLRGRFDVAERARAAGIPVHVVSPPTERMIRQTETTAVRIRPGVYLEWLAETTGGRFLVALPEPVRPLGNPLEALGDILDTLRRGDG